MIEWSPPSTSGRRPESRIEATAPSILPRTSSPGSRSVNQRSPSSSSPASLRSMPASAQVLPASLHSASRMATGAPAGPRWYEELASYGTPRIATLCSCHAGFDWWIQHRATETTESFPEPPPHPFHHEGTKDTKDTKAMKKRDASMRTHKKTLLVMFVAIRSLRALRAFVVQSFSSEGGAARGTPSVPSAPPFPNDPHQDASAARAHHSLQPRHCSGDSSDTTMPAANDSGTVMSAGFLSGNHAES